MEEKGEVRSEREMRVERVRAWNTTLNGRKARSRMSDDCEKGRREAE